MTVTDEQRCLHEMLPGQCSLCLGLRDDGLYYAVATDTDYRDRRAKPPEVTAVRALSAEFESACRGRSPSCTGKIRAGDVIVHEPDLNAWVCLACADSP